MDFIVKLPLFKDTITDIKYNSILVVVDRLTKYAHFIPWREKGNAKDLAKVILKEIIANHGILQSIISDRDKLFISKFWNTWTRQLGTKIKLLTAYHPQTDRQTEQTNQTLEQYLRHYINFKQKQLDRPITLSTICVQQPSTQYNKNFTFLCQLWQTP